GFRGIRLESCHVNATPVAGHAARDGPAVRGRSLHSRSGPKHRGSKPLAPDSEHGRGRGPAPIPLLGTTIALPPRKAAVAALGHRGTHGGPAPALPRGEGTAASAGPPPRRPSWARRARAASRATAEIVPCSSGDSSPLRLGKRAVAGIHG